MDRMIRILLADDNVEFCEILREAIDAQEDMECIACVHDGEAALAAIREHSPDLIILDHVMPSLDGLGVLEAIRGAEHRPKVLMLTAFGHENLIQRASNLGADYYIMKPFDIPTLIVRVRQIADPTSAAATFQQERRRQLIEKQVAKQLSTLGVPPHFKGYMYLKDAVTLVALDPDLLGHVTTKLYPLVAQMRKSSPEKVERAIRHAIESTWTRGNLDSIERLFAYSIDANKGKPTNSSFIARLADQVRMEMMAS